MATHIEINLQKNLAESGGGRDKFIIFAVWNAAARGQQKNNINVIAQAHGFQPVWR